MFQKIPSPIQCLNILINLKGCGKIATTIRMTVEYHLY